MVSRIPQGFFTRFRTPSFIRNPDRLSNLARALASSAAISNTPPPLTVNHIVIPTDQLRSSYQQIADGLTRLNLRVLFAVHGTPFFSMGWLALTEQSLWESPVALAILLAGGGICSQAILQILRIKRFACLGIRCDLKGPSASSATNKKIHSILKGGDPLVRVQCHQVRVSGPIGRDKDPIPSQNTLKRILSIQKIRLPEVALTVSMSQQVTHIHDRWLTRITIPFSIINILAIVAKAADKDAKLKPDDYVVLAASLKNLHNFFSNSSLHEEVKKFEALLSDGASVQDIITILVNKDLLDGPFSFLIHWANEIDTISIRVDRTGNLCIYNYEKRSFLGPMPAQPYPKK